MFGLENKIAVITGGGSGIGKAIAVVFAQQGARILIIDVDEENAKQIIEEIRNKNGKVQFYLCDVTDQKQVNAIFERIGAINILINCAGIANIGKADTTKEEEFDKVISVNVKGVYNCIHAAIPQLRRSGGGVIINISSIAAWTGIADRFAYSTAKGAIAAMTLSVAKDYIHENIRCNSISPARVHTPFVDGYLKNNYPGKEKEMFEQLSKTQPIGRMGKPEEVAYLANYLCSDEAAFITGCDYPIDGGFLKLNT